MNILAFLSIFFTAFNAFAFDCSGVEVAKTLDTMLDVGRFHNCAFEALKIESEDVVSYLVYGKDLFRCKTTAKCPVANFEITIKKECLNKTINILDVEKNSNGYNLDGRMMRNHMQINFNSNKKPIQIAFGQSDLAEAKKINYVKCQLNPLSGK